MSHAGPKIDPDDERRQAERALERLRHEPTFAGSSLAAAGRRAADHFAGKDATDAEPPDTVELWGRRIGRTLSLAGCIALAIYLYVTYLR